MPGDGVTRVQPKTCVRLSTVTEILRSQGVHLETQRGTNEEAADYVGDPEKSGEVISMEN